MNDRPLFNKDIYDILCVNEEYKTRMKASRKASAFLVLLILAVDAAYLYFRRGNYNVIWCFLFFMLTFLIINTVRVFFKKPVVCLTGTIQDIENTDNLGNTFYNILLSNDTEVSISAPSYKDYKVDLKMIVYQYDSNKLEMLPLCTTKGERNETEEK